MIMQVGGGENHWSFLKRISSASTTWVCKFSSFTTWVCKFSSSTAYMSHQKRVSKFFSSSATEVYSFFSDPQQIFERMEGSRKNMALHRNGCSWGVGGGSSNHILLFRLPGQIKTIKKTVKSEQSSCTRGVRGEVGNRKTVLMKSHIFFESLPVHYKH